MIWVIHFATNHTSQPTGIAGHTVPAVDFPGEMTAATRPVYPFSVIAGGAYSPGELRFADRKDPIVRSHYADFNMAKVKPVQLTADRYEYVSYRLKNKVFWTKKKLRIPKGELLLTDGVNYARTRCGNRLSDKPQAAISPDEPDDKLLSMPPADPQLPLNSALPGPSPLGGLTKPENLPFNTTTGAGSPPEPGTVSKSYQQPVGGPPPVLPVGGVASAPVGGPILATGGGTPGSPATPGSPTAPGTPQPPANPTPPDITPVPEPKSIYLFLLTFVLSSWAIVRMNRKTDEAAAHDSDSKSNGD